MAEPDSPLMTSREYAAHRGCSPAAITKAVQSGRISVVRIPGKPRYKINPDIADVEWSMNTKIHTHSACGPPKPPAQIRPKPPAKPPRKPAAALPKDLEAEIHDLHRSRAKREYHEANLSEMKALEKAGTLVDRKKVEAATIGATAMLRLALEQIPGKLGTRLAAERSAHKCRELLTVAIDQALNDASVALTKAASG